MDGGGGGFLFDVGNASRRVTDEGVERMSGQSKDSDGLHERSASVKQIRALTQKQEVRLMTYLDDAFLNLTRNYSKRYTAPESSSVSTLDAYVMELERVVGIIASIPPVGSSAALLVSYLLRATSEICDGIQGYDLADTSEDDTDVVAAADKVQRYLQQTVQVLDMYDRVWYAVLRGHSVNLDEVRKHVREAGTLDAQAHAHVLSITSAVRSPAAEITGRYADDLSSSRSTESCQVLGSKGFGTVGQTHRIRLRNVIVLAKEDLFAWMRTQMNAPLPPTIDGSEREARQERKELVGVEGDMDQAEEMKRANDDEQERDKLLKEGDKDDDDNNLALEAVDTTDIDDPQQTGEQKHFTDLFSKSIDPDASEQEDGDDADDDASERSRKRARRDSRRNSDDGDVASENDDNTLPPPTEAESEATFGLTSGPTASAIMRWDVAFAHLFSRTLRCLSDLQEYGEQRTERQRAQAHEDAGVLGL